MKLISILALGSVLMIKGNFGHASDLTMSPSYTGAGLVLTTLDGALSVSRGTSFVFVSPTATSVAVGENYAQLDPLMQQELKDEATELLAMGEPYHLSAQMDHFIGTVEVQNLRVFTDEDRIQILDEISNLKI